MTPLMRWMLPRGLMGPNVDGYVAFRAFNVDGAAYGGLIGPVRDAARFLRMHLADGELDGVRILSAGSARLMRSISTMGKPFDLGLGWFRPAKAREASPAFVQHRGRRRRLRERHADLPVGVVGRRDDGERDELRPRRDREGARRALRRLTGSRRRADQQDTSPHRAQTTARSSETPSQRGGGRRCHLNSARSLIASCSSRTSRTVHHAGNGRSCIRSTRERSSFGDLGRSPGEARLHALWCLT